MISERKALATRVEGRDCVIEFDGDAPAIGTAPQILLDSRGKLVGVDLAGDGFGRVVVMRGANEDVASQRPARVTISGQTLRVTGGAAFV
jgi:hypothetical protein